MMQYLAMPRLFSDYPQVYLYQAHMIGSKRFSDHPTFTTDGWGHSYTSRKEALLKAMTEGMERYAQFCFRNSEIFYSSFKDLKQAALDPFLYIENDRARTEKLGWIKGKNLTTNTDTLIPAQLAYLTYMRHNKEILLQHINTTGSAGGFDPEWTLLRALYEAVERDSFMNTFLGKFPAKKIDLNSLKSRSLKKTIDYISSFNLSIYLFDITTDLSIPTYLVVTLDKTGLGPALGLGTKTSFDRLEAITGAVEESAQTFMWTRRKILAFREKPIDIKPEQVTDLPLRSLYWSGINKIKELDFLLNQDPQPAKDIKRGSDNSRKTSKDAIKMLKNIGCETFMVDLTQKGVFSFNYYVYKVLIPGLQYLPLDENKKRTNLKRLNQVAKFYNTTVKVPNLMPQPFL